MGRALFLGVLLLVSASCGANARTFSEIDRAGRRVEAVITAKGDLPHFRQALADYSAAIDAVKSKSLSAREQTVVTRYESVRQSLEDIRLVWEEREKRQQELLPLAEPLPARLQKTYDLPVNTNEPPSIYASEARTLIWNAAKKQLDALAGE